jgi:hypothetical protein
MKTTYKLFGTYWDGMESSNKVNLNTIKPNTQGSDFISFQKLLSVRDETDYDSLVLPFQEYKTVTVGIDYWTDSCNPVLRTFLEKRLSQIISHLSKSFDEISCVRV